MEGNKKMIKLTPVPDIYKTLSPPFPAFRKTTCGQAFLCFFTKQYGFSNHYLADFEIDGVTYCCSEQYYMFKKASRFGFFGVANEIMHTKDTTMIKYLGNANTMRERQANGSELNSRFFDHDEWRKVKGKIMYTALYAKFEQNVQLFNMLLATENAKLIEASPSDLFWGIGCGIDSEEILRIDKWRGSNYLGVLLMRLRKEFQARFKLNVDEFDDCF